MPSGILIVQSRPSSPEEADAYHRWYEETHIPEMMGVDHFLSARRLAADDGESFLIVYEVDDVEGAQQAMGAFRAEGKMSPPVGVQTDPPPSVQWCTERLMITA